MHRILSCPRHLPFVLANKAENSALQSLLLKCRLNKQIYSGITTCSWVQAADITLIVHIVCIQCTYLLQLLLLHNRLPTSPLRYLLP